MRLIGILMTACVILAAAQAVAVALAILLGLAFLYTCSPPRRRRWASPRCCWWRACPLAFLGLVGLLVVVTLLTNHRG